MGINFSMKEILSGIIGVVVGGVGVSLFITNRSLETELNTIQSLKPALDQIIAVSSRAEALSESANTRAASALANVRQMEAEMRRKVEAINAVDVISAVEGSIDTLKGVAEKVALSAAKSAIAERRGVLNSAYLTEPGPESDLDSGRLPARTLQFQKASDDTVLRIGYTDAFRVKGRNKACRWSIQFNGNSCPSGALFFDRHDGADTNTHTTAHVAAYCSGLPAATYELSILVGPHPNTYYADSDCYTGWNNLPWTLEVLEFAKQG